MNSIEVNTEAEIIIGFCPDSNSGKEFKPDLADPQVLSYLWHHVPSTCMGILSALDVLVSLTGKEQTACAKPLKR